MESDTEIENLLRQVNDEHFQKYGKHEVIIYDYVDVAINFRVDSSLKLRLLSHLLTPPHQELLDHRYCDHAIDDAITMLQEKYKRVYDQWWPSFIEELREDYPEPSAMLNRLMALRESYPNIMHFGDPLKRDFQLSVDSLIKQIQRSEELRKVRTGESVSSANRPPIAERKNSAPSNSEDPSESIKPIWWNGTQVQLLYSFEVQRKLGWISEETYRERFDYIKLHYVDKGGARFKIDDLRQGDRNYRKNKLTYGRPRDGELYEEALESLDRDHTEE